MSGIGRRSLVAATVAMPAFGGGVARTYGHVLLIADAIERAGAADREKLMAALQATDTSTGPARYYLGGHLSFQPNGRRTDPVPAVFQWKNGVPLTVLPEADAQAELTWPKPV